MFLYLALLNAIAYFIALVLAVWILLANDDERIKLLIAALILVFYVIPLISPFRLPSLIWFFGRITLGMGCYFYLRWHGFLIK